MKDASDRHADGRSCRTRSRGRHSQPQNRVLHRDELRQHDETNARGARTRRVEAFLFFWHTHTSLSILWGGSAYDHECYGMLSIEGHGLTA